MAEDSFATRVKRTVKGRFDPAMRRSFQSIALYEADRCLLSRYPSLRPFQRKFALYSTTLDLLQTLDFLSDYYRVEIMFRTITSKDPLAPDLAWRRMKSIDREIKTLILPKIKEIIQREDNSKMIHDEVCDLFLQQQYEESTQNYRPFPPSWEYQHLHIFLTYRVYYRGLSIDPNIFPAIPPRVVDVPEKKPDNIRNCVFDVQVSSDGVKSIQNVVTGDCNKSVANRSDTSSFPELSAVSHDASSVDCTDEERRALLREVKDHTELLRQFEGIIPHEELARRKRALYLALPPVPRPLGERIAARGANHSVELGDKVKEDATENTDEAMKQAKRVRVEANALDEDDWERENSLEDDDDSMKVGESVEI